MNKLLITGANGFIGSALARHIAATDPHTQVTCLVRSTSNLAKLKSVTTVVKFVNGDVRDKQSLLEAVKGMDYVVHCAAVLRVTDTRTYYDVNVRGTNNLLEAIAEANPHLKAFVQVSSQAAGGPSKSKVPKFVAEGNNPVSHYGKSKLAAEGVVEGFKAKLPKTKVVVLRPAAVYGPEDKDVFMFFQYADKQGFLPAFAKDLHVQFTFVDDLVRLCAEVLKRHAGIPDGTYYAAEQECYRISEVAELFSKLMNKKVRVVRIPLAIGYTMAFFAEKFSSVFLGKPSEFNRDKIDELKNDYWTCHSSEIVKYLPGFRYTPMSEGAKVTYQWYKDNGWS